MKMPRNVIDPRAAAAYSPEVRRALSDRRHAPQIAALITDYVGRRDGGLAAIGDTPSEIRVPSLPSTPDSRGGGHGQ